MERTQMIKFLNFIQLPLGEPGDGQALLLPGKTDWDWVFRLVRKHNVICLGYEALKAIPENSLPEPELRARWKQACDQNTMLCIYQQAALEEVTEVFEAEKIPCIPLKGAVLRAYYPRPDLRSMADLDILIKEKDAQRACRVLKKLGYSGKVTGNRKDDVYTRDCVTLEIHYHLSDSQRVETESLWRNAVPKEGHSYCLEMRPEDMYLHLMGHILDHMESGGIGVKAFLDIRIWLERFGNTWDTAFLEAALKERGLLLFHRRLLSLMDCWRSWKQVDTLSESWTAFILDSGAYGKRDNYIVRSPALADPDGAFTGKKKLLYLWKRLFPDYEELCRTCTGAQKGRFFYLYYAGKRIWKNGVLRFRQVNSELQKVRHMDGQKVRELERLYDQLGVQKNNTKTPKTVDKDSHKL